MFDSEHSIERLNELCYKNKVGWVDVLLTAPVISSTRDELDAEVGSDKKRSRSLCSGSMDLSDLSL